MAKRARLIADAMEKLLHIAVFRDASRPTWPEADFADRMFAQLSPDCVFDVGANVGQYASNLRSNGYDGTILSFEPNSAAFAKLESAAADDEHWHCHPYAFGAVDGMMPFNVMKLDLFSSFHAPLANDDTPFDVHNQISHTVDVPVATIGAKLSELKARHGFKNPFLKLDTQGFDIEVLRGAAGAIGEFCGLLSEVSILSTYAGAPTIAESFAAFYNAGFYVAGLFNVHSEMAVRQIFECNCYCIRKDLAAP